MTNFDTLAAGLRRWTATHDPHVRAAVELLIWHEYWLRRSDFIRACIKWDGTCGTEPGRGVAWITWVSAREFADSHPRASTSESAVLDLAVAIGSDQYKLNQMGDAHAQAIVKAFADARQVPIMKATGP